MTDANSPTPDHDAQSIEQLDAEYGEIASWFANISTLDFLTPHEAAGADCWAIRDEGDIVGMALVEPEHPSSRNDDAVWVHRIGVLDDRQGEGFGRALLERIHEEYGPLELEVDAEKPANHFYEAIGMDLVEERPAVMNDGSEGTLNIWRWSSD